MIGKSMLAGAALMVLCGGAQASTMVTLENGVNGVSVLDTHVRISHPTLNFGGETQMQVGGALGGSPTYRYGLLEFNDIFGNGTGQIPVSNLIQIDSAVLRLHLGAVSSEMTSNPVTDKFRVNPTITDVTSHYGTKTGAAATAGEMNWNYKSFNTVGWGTAETGSNGPIYDQDYNGTNYLADQDISNTTPVGTIIEWDVTDMVQAWLDFENGNGGIANHGFLLRNVGSNWVLARFTSVNAGSANDPQLVVTFSPIPEPASLALVGMGLALMVRRR